jgi:mRNA interferase MazF
MYKKGTIVLVPFPFTDLSGNKVRPALIISNGKSSEDVIVVFITSQSKLKGKNLIAVVPDERNGLKVPSKIVCSKVATLDVKIVLGELGVVSNLVLQKINAELRMVLGL